MEISVLSIYPKVFQSFTKAKVYFELSGDGVDESLLSVRIMPMEIYSVPHTENYVFAEEYRYPCQAVVSEGNGRYFVEYDFTDEQRYSFKVNYEDKVILSKYLFAVDGDLRKLKPFKGDLHIHTNRSDGLGEPFDVAVDYRAAGFDFIAITDHHRYAPSLEAKAEIEALTDDFYCFPGEEVHLGSMGYFHAVNFNGKYSVNDIVKNDPEYMWSEVEKIMQENDLSALPDPKAVALRMWMAREIKKSGGVAIMAHPYWEWYGEYHMQRPEFNYHWRNGHFDVLEVIAGCDYTGRGNNLQEMLRQDLLCEGIKIPVVGTSDAHSTDPEVRRTHFDVQFSIVFAESFEEIPEAIKDERAVAIERQGDKFFHAEGKYRYVNLARFLIREYYPKFRVLTEAHAEALRNKNVEEIKMAEEKIVEFRNRFFGI
ncbi:MAG: PHP domain-containing protein [Clostridia bacterium]|nr:PHP domain-containing protein [Clostridia bacterium]